MKKIVAVVSNRRNAVCNSKWPRMAQYLQPSCIICCVHCISVMSLACIRLGQSRSVRTRFFLYAMHGAHSGASQNLMCRDSQITNQQFKFNYVGTNFSLLGIRGNVIAFINAEACNSSCSPPFFFCVRGGGGIWQIWCACQHYLQDSRTVYTG